MCDADYPELPPIYGINTNGGFQTHLTVSEVGDLFKVDQGLPLEAACLLPCGGLTAFNSLETIRESMDMAMNITGGPNYHYELCSKRKGHVEYNMIQVGWQHDP